MSGCSFGLIWSSEKFVNNTISKSHPSTLCNFKLCDETSITTASTPAATIWLKICCNSKLSGVVLSLSFNFWPFIYVAIVPIKPTFLPDFSNISLIINVVVVFPFVPVTPINLNFLDGLP